MKNCPVELVISFRTFRAAPGAALKDISTTLRSINGGAGVPAGLAIVVTFPRPRAGDGVAFGVGLDDAACSSGKGRRRNAVILSTFASSKMLTSICTCESSCPSNAATAVLGMVLANSSNPSSNLSGNFTLFVRARSSTARVAWRRRAKLHRRHRTHRSLRHRRNAAFHVLGPTTDDTDQFSFVMSSKVETSLISNSERWLVITIFGSTSLSIAITRYFISP